MERRGFLKGVFGGVTSAGLLITGNISDIEAFAAPLVKQTPLLIDNAPPTTRHVESGEHLYNSRGELVAIVTAVRVTIPSIDVTSALSDQQVSIAGLPTFSIEAEGVGMVALNNGRPEFRGVRRRE